MTTLDDTLDETALKNSLDKNDQRNRRDRQRQAALYACSTLLIVIAALVVVFLNPIIAGYYDYQAQQAALRGDTQGVMLDETLAFNYRYPKLGDLDALLSITGAVAGPKTPAPDCAHLLPQADAALQLETPPMLRAGILRLRATCEGYDHDDAGAVRDYTAAIMLNPEMYSRQQFVEYLFIANTEAAHGHHALARALVGAARQAAPGEAGAFIDKMRRAKRLPTALLYLRPLLDARTTR